jgi:hypothetical protein
LVSVNGKILDGGTLSFQNDGAVNTLNHPNCNDLAIVISKTGPHGRSGFEAPHVTGQRTSNGSGPPCVPNLPTGEVPFHTRTNPERYAAGGIAELEIIHDQTRLRPAMHIQSRIRAFHTDPVGALMRNLHPDYFVNSR